MEDDLKKMEDDLPEKRKTTSKKMEDDLNNFFKSKTTLIFYTGRRPKFFQDVRWPHIYLNGRRPKKNLVIVTNVKVILWPTLPRSALKENGQITRLLCLTWLCGH